MLGCVCFSCSGSRIWREKGHESGARDKVAQGLRSSREAAGVPAVICGTRSRLLSFGHVPCLSNVVSRGLGGVMEEMIGCRVKAG